MTGMLDYLLMRRQQEQDEQTKQALMAAQFYGTPQDQVNITPRISAAGPSGQALMMPSPQGPMPGGGASSPMPGQGRPMSPGVPIPATATQPGQGAGGDNPQLALRAAAGMYNGPAAPGDPKALLAAMSPQMVAQIFQSSVQQKVNPKAQSALGQLSQDLKQGLIKPGDFQSVLRKETYVPGQGPESPLGKLADDYQKGRISKAQYDAAVAKENNIPGQGAASPLGKLAEDFKAGRISQQDYNAAVLKENRIPPAAQPTDASYLAPVLAKIQKGEPLTESDNAVLSVLKPSANVELPPGANVPGTLGAPKIDVSAEGYSTKPVPNTGGLTQSAIDQGAIEFATTGRMPPGMGIGSTGAGGQRKNAIQNRAGELNVGGNMAANSTQLKSFSQSLGQQQKYLDTTQRALNTANDTLDALQEWMQKNGVNPSQFPDANRFYNFLKAKGVDPGMAGGYNAQLATLRAEYSQVLSKGGVRSVETDREAAKLIPDGLPPSAIAQVAERIRVDADNVVRDSQNQVSKITGQMNNILGGNASAPYAPPPAGGALPAGVTEEDIKHTLSLHPEMTREKLLQKLGGK